MYNIFVDKIVLFAKILVGIRLTTYANTIYLPKEATETLKLIESTILGLIKLRAKYYIVRKRGCRKVVL